VPLDIELAGDIVLYGGSAYPQFATESAPPEGEMAVVITDVKGSTALWEWNADVMKEADEMHLKVLRDNIARLDGYEFMDEGDSLSIAFHNSLDAMKFAMLSQTDLMNIAWPQELFDHPDGCKEDGIYNGLRVRMAVETGFGRKFLNKSTNRLSYDGEVVVSCNAILKAVDDGGVVIASLHCIEDIKSKFSHREYEFGKVELQDMGSFRFKELKDPLPLVQMMPQWLNNRPPAQLSNVTLCQKAFAQAPGVVNPGEPVAIIFCTLMSTKAEKDEGKTDADMASATDLLWSAVFECDGYVSTKTSQGVALIAFSTAEDSFRFLNKMSGLLQSGHNAHLNFCCGLHFGIPNAVAANKASGKADYLGPAANAATRLLTLASETPSFKIGNFAGAVSHSAWSNIDHSNRKDQLNLQGKFMLKGSTEEIEVFAFQPASV